MMFKLKWAGAALAAALTISAAPASAAGFIGDTVVINRLYQGNVFLTGSATVGAGLEYTDNFFGLDISGNEVRFSARAGSFSTGDIIYEIYGLDYDDNPATPNAIQSFASSQFFEGGLGATPLNPNRALIKSDGALRVQLDNAHGGGAAYASLTFGPAIPSAVPEPASWAMMIAGFGVTGAAMRRRRKASQLSGRSFDSFLGAIAR